MRTVTQRGGEALPPVAVSVDTLYRETYRPQFHFTARQGWLNDPNGLVYYKGTYHLFFQHNPTGTEWGNMTWGHAVSPDLVHWRQLDHAIVPDRLGTVFSGSAVVDVDNTTGFEAGGEKTLVCVYTAAGGTSPESQGQPFTQALAYSTDAGVTWAKFAGNPVLGNVAPENRDPKVIWHAPSRRWVMALYVGTPDPERRDEKGRPAVNHAIQFFASPDLKQWTYLSRIEDFYECPDLFELPVDGNPGKPRWVLFAANGHYLIGHFDGRQFVRDSGKHIGDAGANYYAAQTFSDIPVSDGRRILIGWMRGGKYPGMPFNQQMTFPCELTLRTLPEGIRLFRYPVREIALLHENEQAWRDLTVRPGDDPLAQVQGELLDLEIEFVPAGSGEVALTVRGETVTYAASSRTLFCRGKSAVLLPVSETVRLRLLVDRTSLEIFGNEGYVAMSFCILPHPQDRACSLAVHRSPVKVRALCVRRFRSMYEAF